jgi:hypothetical protein
MKTYWGVEVQLHVFMVSALDSQLYAPAALPQGKVP